MPITPKEAEERKTVRDTAAYIKACCEIDECLSSTRDFPAIWYYDSTEFPPNITKQICITYSVLGWIVSPFDSRSGTSLRFSYEAK